MKRFILVLIASIFCSQLLIAQNYEFNRASMMGAGSNSTVKFNGEVFISDSIISINSSGTISKFSVDKLMDVQGVKQFKAVMPNNSDYDIRFTFQKSDFLKKKETHTLYYEAKDNFSGTITNILYYLIPKE